jgi:peptide/nickel transport system permease protein
MAANVQAQPAVAALTPPKERARSQNRVLRRFLRYRTAVLGLIIMIALLILVFFGSVALPYDLAVDPVPGSKLRAPSEAHFLGTDQIGRDVLARAVYGGQISLIIGVTAMLLSLLVGTLVGAVAGCYGGAVDNLLMRLTEAVLTIPRLFLLLTMSKFFGGRIPPLNLFGREFSGSVIVIVVILGITSWPSLARIVRAQILSIKQMEFVLAAESLGVTRRRILLRHILPNATATIIVSATLGIAGAIQSEAYISFLGLGVDSRTPTWGNMLNLAPRYLGSAPWMWLVPGALLLLTVLAVNFVGDGLRDALDPKSQKVL